MHTFGPMKQPWEIVVAENLDKYLLLGDDFVEIGPGFVADNFHDSRQDFSRYSDPGAAFSERVTLQHAGKRPTESPS